MYPSIYLCNFQLASIHLLVFGSELNQGKGLGEFCDLLQKDAYC